MDNKVYSLTVWEIVPNIVKKIVLKLSSKLFPQLTPKLSPMNEGQLKWFGSSDLTESFEQL